MSCSNSSPTNTTSTTTNAKETNVSAANTSGVTVLGNKGPVSLSSSTSTTNITTDNGAVTAAVGLGSTAIAANTGLSESVATCSYNFANHALDVLSSEQTASASLVSNYLAQGAADLNQAEAGYLSLASASETANNTQLGNIATTLSNIATANDTTQAAQSTQFAQTALLIAAGAAVLIIFLMRSK